MTATEFIIRQSDEGLEVIDPKTGATSGQLTTGELIEQIIALFEIGPRHPYPMRSPEEWEARSRAMGGGSSQFFD